MYATLEERERCTQASQNFEFGPIKAQPVQYIKSGLS